MTIDMIASVLGEQYVVEHFFKWVANEKSEEINFNPWH